MACVASVMIRVVLHTQACSREVCQDLFAGVCRQEKLRRVSHKHRSLLMCPVLWIGHVMTGVVTSH